MKVTSEALPTEQVLTTSPTLTPAIRTGESLRMFAEFSNTAFTSYSGVNGIDFVHAR